MYSWKYGDFEYAILGISWFLGPFLAWMDEYRYLLMRNGLFLAFWPLWRPKGQKKAEKKLVSKCLKLPNSSRKSKKKFSKIFGLRSEVAEVRGCGIRTFWGRGSFLYVQADILAYLTSLKVEGYILPGFRYFTLLWTSTLISRKTQMHGLDNFFPQHYMSIEMN